MAKRAYPRKRKATVRAAGGAKAINNRGDSAAQPLAKLLAALTAARILVDVFTRIWKLFGHQ